MQIAYQSDTWAGRKSGPVSWGMDIEGVTPSNLSLQRIGGGERKWEPRRD